MRRAWWCALGVLLCVLVRPGGAQGAGYLRHQAWSTEDGLPQDSVHAVAQTPDGYVWAATEGGVARFDGVSFRVYGRATEPAFRSDDSCCLEAGPDGALWVGTSDGVVRLGNGHAAGEGTPARWWGVAEGLPAAGVTRLATVGGRVVVETAAGAVAWDGERWVPVGAPEAGTTRAGGVVWRWDDAAVWTGNRRWTAGRELPGSRVETVFAEATARAWVGTNAGLVEVDGAGAGGERPVPALDGNVVLSVMEDREGSVWVGTESGGLHLLAAIPFRAAPGVAPESVNAVVESAGTMWMGTRRDGLRRMREGGREETVPERTLTSPVVVSMAPAEGGGVWVGTPDGLNRVSARGEVRQWTSAEGLPDDSVQALAPDGAGGVWAGTRRGLAHVQETGMEVIGRTEGLPGELVGVLLRTRSGVLWAGTTGGLARLRGGVVERVAGVNGRVSAMAEDGAGTVWVATDQGELRWFGGDGGGGRVEGVADEARGMGVDREGWLWLREAHGVERVPVASVERCAGKTMQCVEGDRRYGVADGLPSAEVAPGGSPVLWMRADGELWMGTRRGVAVAEPGRMPVNGVAPPVVIERVLVDGRVAEASGGAIEVPNGSLRVTVEYAGLSFVAPGEVRYRTQMAGLEEGWTDVGGRRSATYTTLRPGRYVFRVEARNGDGVWSATEASVRLRVVPPVWRRWWFLLLVAAGAAGLVLGGYFLRERRVRRQFEAVLRERNRLAREIHDTLAQDFVGVTLQLDMIQQLLGLGKAELAMEQVQATRRLVTDGLTEARQSIWGLRAGLGEKSLPTRMTELAERYRSEHLAVRLAMGGAYRAVEGRVEDEVVRVAQEALSNVARHSGAAEARVELDYRSGMLMLTVTDTGRGFTPHETERMTGHYGVRGMHERAELIGAELEIVSAAGEGTAVRLRCAIPNESGAGEAS